MKPSFLLLLLALMPSCDQPPPATTAAPAVPKINWDAPVAVKYRIQVGDAISNPQTVTIVTRPRLVDGFQLTYHYPDYLKLPDKTEPSYGEIAAYAGTTVSLKGKINRPVKLASIKFDGQPAAAPGAQLVKEGDDQFLTWSITLTPGMDSAWSYELEDDFGIKSLPLDSRIRTTNDLEIGRAHV